MRSVNLEGIVLARKDFGEADSLVIIFTREKGKIKTLAKGARKIVSKKGGLINTFSRIKFRLERTKSIDLLLEPEMLESFSDWYKDLKKVSVAYHFVEVVDCLTREYQESEEIYKLLQTSLEDLKNEKSLREKIEEFDLELLSLLGFGNKKDVDPIFYIEELCNKRLGSLRVGKKILS